MGLLDKILIGETDASTTTNPEIHDENVRRIEEEERKRKEMEAPATQEGEETELLPDQERDDGERKGEGKGTSKEEGKTAGEEEGKGGKKEEKNTGEEGGTSRERKEKGDKENDEPLSKDEEELLKFMQSTAPKIYVVGTGGSGCNTVTRMVEGGGVYGSHLLAMNTDAQHLFKVAKVERKLLLGKKRTKGLGAGSNPEVGEQAAEESAPEVKILLQDADLVFVTCGMGGGTGTGSAHIIAKSAKENGALVVAVVTMPFSSEGHKRMQNALKGLEKLKGASDTTIVIPNDRLLMYVPDLPLNQAFKVADEVLGNAVRGIAELVTRPGLVNLDFADLRTILRGSGMAMIGLGENGQNKGKDRIVHAARKALSSPLLEVDISEADRALVNITGGEDMTLAEAEAAVNTISGKIAKEAHVIWGATVDKAMTGKGVRVLAVLSGITDAFGGRGKKEGEEFPETLNLEFIT